MKKIVWLILLLTIILVIIYHFITVNKLEDDTYQNLKISFINEDDTIILNQENNTIWTGWKLISGYNGFVQINPEEIDLSDLGDYQLSFTISSQDKQGKTITKEYTKKVSVVRLTPEIILKEKILTLSLNDSFEPNDYYSIDYLNDWILTVDCDIDTTKMGRYYLTISVKDPLTDETISDQMLIDVIDKSILEEGCQLIWIIDKPAVEQQGHYSTIYVDEKGHYENVLVSEEEGHYETIHHPAITHQEDIWEEFQWYRFYKREYYSDDDGNLTSRQVDIITKSSYEIQEMYPDSTFSQALNNYFQYLIKDYDCFGYIISNDRKKVGSYTVTDEEAWDEQVWIIDKPAVYDSIWVIDQKAYSYQIWVIDVEKQNEIGHWEKKCNN